MIVWAIYVDDVFFMKDARGLLKSIDLLDSTLIVSLLSQVIVDYLKHSLSC